MSNEIEILKNHITNSKYPMLKQQDDGTWGARSPLSSFEMSCKIFNFLNLRDKGADNLKFHKALQRRGLIDVNWVSGLTDELLEKLCTDAIEASESPEIF